MLELNAAYVKKSWPIKLIMPGETNLYNYCTKLENVPLQELNFIKQFSISVWYYVNYFW
jgi:hypothetical protein